MRQHVLSRRRLPTSVAHPPERMISRHLPPIWGHVAPAQQRQLAQLVAALIRHRYRQQPPSTEKRHDQLAHP